MSQDGDTVGSQVRVIIKTPADLDEITMSAARIGVHLHVDLEGLSLMPTRQQLIEFGGDRYLFLFDLPAAKAGKNTIDGVLVRCAASDHGIDGAIRHDHRQTLTGVRQVQNHCRTPMALWRHPASGVTPLQWTASDLGGKPPLGAGGML